MNLLKSGIVDLVIEQKEYWNGRFIEGEIWGTEPCPSAVMSINFLKRNQSN
jgi:hypothetical protein